MALAVPRTLLDTLHLANPLYASARVYAYEADVATGKITTRLAPLYDAPAGSGQLSNPTRLDGDGKWPRPVYVDRPVVLRITDAAVPSHDTGVLGLDRAFRGDWERGQSYLAGQVVRDGAAGLDTGNLYIATQPHLATDTWLVALNREKWVLYLEAGATTSPDEDAASAAVARPGDYGAIGDGSSHPAGAHLGLGSLAALQAYKGGIYSFAHSLDQEIDELAIQAALRAGKRRVRMEDSKTYVITTGLESWNAHIFDVDMAGSTIDATRMVATPASNINLIDNGGFANSDGWQQTTLMPSVPFTFSGGKGIFTDPYTASTPYSFGQMGRQVTVPEGKWSALLTVTTTPGASAGILGRPYVGIGFFADGVGLGSFEYTSPLYRGTTFFNYGTETLQVDFEVPAGGGSLTFFYAITCGNCNVEVDNAIIRPYAVDAALWGNPRNQGLPYVDASWWRNGRIIGPGRNSGVRGVLRKSFAVDDKRLNLEDVDVVGFSGGHWFSDQAYLNVIRGGATGECDPCVVFQAGSINAGENIRFGQHIFYNSGLVFDLRGGGEFTATDVSLDYCDKYVLADRGAILTVKGEHKETRHPETYLLYDAKTADFSGGATLTGGTSGATATIIAVEAATSTTGKLIIATTGTFLDNEPLTDSKGGSATANGVVVQGGVLWELHGGSMVHFDTMAILLAGAGHRGAQYLADVADQSSVLALPPWAYNLRTASGVFNKGAGRVIFTKGHQAPGNALLPDLISDNWQSDIFMGAGRISGPNTLTDSGFLGVGTPDDEIGLLMGLYDDGGGSPSNRLLIPYVGGVFLHTDTGPETGFGSLEVEYNGEFYANDLSFRVFAPVQPGNVVLFQYRWRQPATITPPTYGPFSNGVPTAGDTIRVSTEAGSDVATITDQHSSTLGDYGPQVGWTVAVSGVTGDPGGVVNASWNTTFTVLERVRTDPASYKVKLASAATSTAINVGGTGISITYTQTNALVFFRAFWVSLLGWDGANRPMLGNVTYQGEKNILVPAAANAWQVENFGTWYTEAVEPTNRSDRIANGRAPAGATHLMFIWNLPAMRHLKPANKVSLWLGHLKGNRL